VATVPVKELTAAEVSAEQAKMAELAALATKTVSDNTFTFLVSRMKSAKGT
jgi:hypothetical protein